jgi:hypothetical protein
MRATPRPGATLRGLLPEGETTTGTHAPAPAAPKLNGAAKANGNGAAKPASDAKAGDNKGPLLTVDKLVKEYARKDVSSGGFAGPKDANAQSAG